MRHDAVPILYNFCVGAPSWRRVCLHFSCTHTCTCACLDAGPDKPAHLRRHLQTTFEDIVRYLNGERAIVVDQETGELKNARVAVVLGGDRAFLQSVLGLNHQADFCPLCDDLAPCSQKPPAWGRGGPTRKRAMLAMYKLDEGTTFR